MEGLLILPLDPMKTRRTPLPIGLTGVRRSSPAAVVVQNPERSIAMLTRFDPFAELNRFRDELFRDAPPRAFTPAVDIFEDADALTVKAELPGVKVDDVKIDVENNILTLRGERKFDVDRKVDKKSESADAEARIHRVERYFGAFTRQFLLPRTVDPERIEAELKDGVLSLRLPKRSEVKSRQIAVKVAS
jgi:HSP20 family protein